MELTRSLLIRSAISRPAAVPDFDALMAPTIIRVLDPLWASTVTLPSSPFLYWVIPLTVSVSPLVILIAAAPIFALTLLLKCTTAKEPAPVNFAPAPVQTAPEIASA